jgi:ABC-type transporter Mla subunit MlaD
VTSAVEWSPLITAVGVGVGVLLIGIGVFRVCERLGALLNRVGKTLDEVDTQIAALSGPLAQTLAHVGGIADTADATLAKAVVVVGSLETVAENVNKTSTLAQEALAPSLVNLGATLAGVTAALRRLVRGKGPEPAEHG